MDTRRNTHDSAVAMAVEFCAYDWALLALLCFLLRFSQIRPKMVPHVAMASCTEQERLTQEPRGTGPLVSHVSSSRCSDGVEVDLPALQGRHFCCVLTCHLQKRILFSAHRHSWCLAPWRPRHARTAHARPKPYSHVEAQQLYVCTQRASPPALQSAVN